MAKLAEALRNQLREAQIKLWNYEEKERDKQLKAYVQARIRYCSKSIQRIQRYYMKLRLSLAILFVFCTQLLVSQSQEPLCKYNAACHENECFSGGKCVSKESIEKQKLSLVFDNLDKNCGLSVEVKKDTRLVCDVDGEGKKIDNSCRLERILVHIKDGCAHYEVRR